MPRLIVPSVLLAALMAALIACGGEDAAPTATAAPAPAPAVPTAPPYAPEATSVPATAPPSPTAPSATVAQAPTAPAPTAEAAAPTPPPAAPAVSPEEAILAALAEYAAEHANAPGAIFVGNPRQLIGPPPHEGLMFQTPEALYNQASGAALTGLPAMGIPSHMFIFASDYYKGLIEKANLLNPTELTSSGESIEIQHACIDRNLPTCVLIQTYWAPNLAARTNGQVKLSVVSFAELGLAGPDTLQLVSEGTLDMANIYTGYVAGELPPIEVQSLWGMGPDWETTYLALADMAPDIARIVEEATGGSRVVNRNWFAGADQWFFSKDAISSFEDFDGKKVRTHSAAMSDLIMGLGGEPIFVPAAGEYLALQSGVIDVVTTGALLSVPGRMYEIADYMFGPVIGFGYTNNVINREVWDGIPADLQQIIIEEGAKTELEGLRLAPFQNVFGVQANIQLGVKPTAFTGEQVRYISGVVVPQNVIPGWLKRLGYPEKGQEAVDIFNEHAGPYIGLRVEADGSVVRTEITKGPHAN